MKNRTLFIVMLSAFFEMPFYGQTTLPFPGTVPDVRTINTQKLLNIMNGATGYRYDDFVAVAAHRGYWRNNPENSINAMTDAFNAGVEVVEIDVRIASTSPMPYVMNPNGSPTLTGTLVNPSTDDLVASHDQCVDRQTNRQGGLRGNDPKCLTGSTGFTASSFTSALLRTRSGSVSSLHPPTFTQILQAYKSYVSCSSGTLTGPVLVVDLKDKDIPVGSTTNTFVAWNDYKLALVEITNTLPRCTWPAVLFKMKMATHLPSAALVGTEVGSHPGYGNLILTVVPEDATNMASVEADETPEFHDFENVQAGYGPSGISFLPLLGFSQGSMPYVNQFELVPFITNDGAKSYMSSVHTFATYYQPSYYPEGVSNSDASCCYLAPMNTLDLTAQKNAGKKVFGVDERGIVDFSTYFVNSSGLSNGGSVTITSDNLTETMNYLIVSGYRNFTRIQ